MVITNYNKMCSGCGKPLGDNVVCDFGGTYHPECNPLKTIKTDTPENTSETGADSEPTYQNPDINP